MQLVFKNGLDQWFYVGNLIFGETGVKENDEDRCLFEKKSWDTTAGESFYSKELPYRTKKCRTKFFAIPWKISSLLSDGHFVQC